MNGCALTRLVDHVLFTSKGFDAWVNWPLRAIKGRHWSVRAVCGIPAFVWAVAAFWVVMPFVAIVAIVGGVVDMINGDL